MLASTSFFAWLSLAFIAAHVVTASPTALRRAAAAPPSSFCSSFKSTCQSSCNAPFTWSNCNAASANTYSIFCRCFFIFDQTNSVLRQVLASQPATPQQTTTITSTITSSVANDVTFTAPTITVGIEQDETVTAPTSTDFTATVPQTIVDQITTLPSTLTQDATTLTTTTTTETDVSSVTATQHTTLQTTLELTLPSAVEVDSTTTESLETTTTTTFVPLATTTSYASTALFSQTFTFTQTVPGPALTTTTLTITSSAPYRRRDEPTSAPAMDKRVFVKSPPSGTVQLCNAWQTACSSVCAQSNAGTANAKCSTSFFGQDSLSCTCGKSKVNKGSQAFAALQPGSQASASPLATSIVRVVQTQSYDETVSILQPTATSTAIVIITSTPIAQAILSTGTAINSLTSYSIAETDTVFIATQVIQDYETVTQTSSFSTLAIDETDTITNTQFTPSTAVSLFTATTYTETSTNVITAPTTTITATGGVTYASSGNLALYITTTDPASQTVTSTYVASTIAATPLPNIVNPSFEIVPIAGMPLGNGVCRRLNNDVYWSTTDPNLAVCHVDPNAPQQLEYPQSIPFGSQFLNLYVPNLHQVFYMTPLFGRYLPYKTISFWYYAYQNLPQSNTQNSKFNMWLSILPTYVPAASSSPFKWNNGTMSADGITLTADVTGAWTRVTATSPTTPSTGPFYLQYSCQSTSGGPCTLLIDNFQVF